jgi:hypothetical protein
MRLEEDFEAINQLMEFYEDQAREFNEQNADEEEHDACCSNGCMQCLGMTWRDFI